MIKKIIVITLLLILFIPSIADADLAYCFNQAANFYKVPQDVLMAIADVESGFNPYAIDVEGTPYFPNSYDAALNIVDKYRNLSIDIGIMQVNSFWFNKLNYPLRYGLKPCDDVYLGAYVLARKIARYGYNWKGIAAYHSADHTAGLIYANKVYAVLRQLRSNGNG